MPLKIVCWCFRAYREDPDEFHQGGGEWAAVWTRGLSHAGQYTLLVCYLILSLICWTFNFVFFMGRAFYDFNIPTKYKFTCIHISNIAYNLKSTDSSVLEQAGSSFVASICRVRETVIEILYINKSAGFFWHLDHSFCTTIWTWKAIACYINPVWVYKYMCKALYAFCVLLSRACSWGRQKPRGTGSTGCPPSTWMQSRTPS